MKNGRLQTQTAVFLREFDGYLAPKVHGHNDVDKIIVAHRF